MCDKHNIYNLTKPQSTKQNKQLQTLYITTDMFISYVFMVFSGHIMVSYKSKMCGFLRHHEIEACRPVWSTEKCKAVGIAFYTGAQMANRKARGANTYTYKPLEETISMSSSAVMFATSEKVNATKYKYNYICREIKLNVNTINIYTTKYKYKYI